MWGIPADIVAQGDDDEALDWVADQLAEPDEFLDKVDYLYEHPEETAREKIELENGRVFDRYATPLIDKDGTHYGRLWTFRDITERKEGERELKR